MKKQNADRLKMMQAVVNLADNNMAIVVLIVAYKLGINALKSVVNQVLSLAGAQSQPLTTGAGDQKQYYRNILNNITFSIIRPAKGWALSVNNLNLAATLSPSLSSIARISDKLIAERAQNWMSLITPHIDQLEDWGILPESIEAWTAAIAAYQEVYLLPKDKRAAKTQLTAQVNSLIKQGMEICYNTLDPSAIRFKDIGKEEFYQLYRINRRIDNSATAHTKYIVTVTDELGNPVYNVSVQEDGTENKNKTGINGECTLYLKEQPSGNVYQFTLKSGQQTVHSGPVQIKRGRTIRQTFTMQPNGFIIPGTPVLDMDTIHA